MSLLLRLRAALPIASILIIVTAAPAPAGPITGTGAEKTDIARAQQVQVVSEPQPVPQDCTSGGSGTVLCIKEASSPDMSVNVPPIGVPDWCWSYRNVWVAGTRVDACMIRELTVTVTRYQNNQQQVIGAFTYRELNQARVSTSSNAWYQQIGMDLLSWWGELNSISLNNTDAGCYWGTCTRGEWNFPSRGLFSTPLMGTLNIRMDLGYGAAAEAQTFMKYRWTGDAYTVPSSYVTNVPPNVRCDNYAPGLTGYGCVFPSFIPAKSYSLNDTSVNFFARHVYEAQASGLPGAYVGSGMPNTAVLHRLTDQYWIDRNGAKACPSSYPRPVGKSCDEYPFRSTYEGAETGGGPARTNPAWCEIAEPSGSGPYGYSVCMIPADQNSRAGGLLGSFYLSNRVMAGDGFRIWITS